MDFFGNDWAIPTPEDLDQKLSIPKFVKTPRRYQEGEIEPPKRPRKSPYYYSGDGYYSFDTDSEKSDDDDGYGLFD